MPQAESESMQLLTVSPKEHMQLSSTMNMLLSQYNRLNESVTSAEGAHSHLREIISSVESATSRLRERYAFFENAQKRLDERVGCTESSFKRLDERVGCVESICQGLRMEQLGANQKPMPMLPLDALRNRSEPQDFPQASSKIAEGLQKEVEDLRSCVDEIRESIRRSRDSLPSTPRSSMGLEGMSQQTSTTPRSGVGGEGMAQLMAEVKKDHLAEQQVISAVLDRITNLFGKVDAVEQKLLAASDTSPSHSDKTIEDFSTRLDDIERKTTKTEALVAKLTKGARGVTFQKSSVNEFLGQEPASTS
jgi:chromosome segregation ATPase